MACYPIGYLGLMVSPYDLAIGVGRRHRRCDLHVPLILTFIGLRSRTMSGTAALSGFTQSAGYLLAAVGPFTVGLLHDASGGWTLPLWFLISLSVPQVVAGLYAARPAYVEDQLRSRAPSAP